MAWIETTYTIEGKEPTAVCINADHIRYLRPHQRGATILWDVAGAPALIVDMEYRVLVSKVRATRKT